MHQLQLLDDIPFAMFKGEYQCQLLRVNRLFCRYRISRAQFFRILTPAYTMAMTPESIRTGFKNTGIYIYPIDLNAVKLNQTRTSDVYDKCKHYMVMLD